MRSNIVLIDGPRVFPLAKTELIDEGVDNWLTFLTGDPEHCDGIRKQMSGSDGEQLIEMAGRRCYKSFTADLNPNVNKIRTDSGEYHLNILHQKHGSVLAHATLTVAIEDCSRIATHETVRHAIGNAFSQESLRYVRFGERLRIWIPGFMRRDTYVFTNVMSLLEHAVDVYRKLEDYYQLDEKGKGFKVKKWITSALRRFIPMGIATGIVVTFNMRSLRWFIEQRSNPAAEVEIRAIANQLAEIAKYYYPLVFQDMEQVAGEEELGEQVPLWQLKYSKV